MYEANVGAHGTGPRRGDRARRSRGSSRLDGQRLRQHPRPDRRRDVPARPGRRLPELLRRDEVPGPRRRRGADRGRGADRHRRCPARSTARTITRRSARSSRPPIDGTARYIALGDVGHLADVRRRPRRGHRRGARPRPARREPTSWPARTCGFARRCAIAAQAGRPTPAAPVDPDRICSGSAPGSRPTAVGWLGLPPNLARDRPGRRPA